MFKRTTKDISEITEFQDIEMVYDYPVIKCRNGYAYFLSIKGHDLTALKPEEYEEFKDQFLLLYKQYTDDLKLIILTIKTETEKNIDFMKKKLNSTNNMQNSKWLQHQIEVLESIEANNRDLIFILCIYADTKNDILNKRNSVKNILGDTAEDFKKNRLKEIIYKLYNK